MVESSQNRLTEKRSKKNSKSPAKYNTKSTNQGSTKKESQTSSERPRALPPQKPHVGKRIHVYRNGDIYYAGINIVLNSRHDQSLDALLDTISERIGLTHGAKKLYTLDGSQIHHIGELQNNQEYIASSGGFVHLQYGDKKSNEIKSVNSGNMNRSVVKPSRHSRSTEPRKGTKEIHMSNTTARPSARVRASSFVTSKKKPSADVELNVDVKPKLKEKKAKKKNILSIKSKDVPFAQNHLEETIVLESGEPEDANIISRPTTKDVENVHRPSTKQSEQDSAKISNDNGSNGEDHSDETPAAENPDSLDKETHRYEDDFHDEEVAISEEREKVSSAENHTSEPESNNHMSTHEYAEELHSNAEKPSAKAEQV
ncbi:doublecortin domain-containing protein [Ditylenchus destructor]|uniref:Doublecortin domain-containing protein n=1 Tax=Ditylenchus destructor TaxID=166010 RepID=A0AAD4NE47_9BILA|nr:doublecortin domain-containing protein [Ditylenchus destructor]